MSLRSLGYLLTRRFYPRKIYRVQTESSPGIVSQAASVSAAGRPGRSLHTLRDLGAGDNAFGPVVAAALAGGLGILIFKKHPDDAGSSVTNEDTKEVSRKPEVTDNKLLQEVTNVEKQDVDMEAMFREWMKQMGKVYPNQEEERKRFEVFKETVKKTAPRYEKSSVPYLPNHLADMTYEEIKEMRGRNKRVNFDQDLEEHKAVISMMKEREQKMIQKMKKEGKLHNRKLLFPEKQEREQKMKEEGNLQNCSKQ